DVRTYKGRKPPKHYPDHIPMMRLDDAYSHSDEWKGTLHDTIAAGRTVSDAEQQDRLIRDAAAAGRTRQPIIRRLCGVRPESIGDCLDVDQSVKRPRAVLNFMLDPLSEKLRYGRDPHSLAGCLLHEGLMLSQARFGNVQLMNWKNGCLEIEAQSGFGDEFLN